MVAISRVCQAVPSGLSSEAPRGQQRCLEKPVEAGGLRGGGDPCPCVSGRGEGLPGPLGTAVAASPSAGCLPRGLTFPCGRVVGATGSRLVWLTIQWGLR